MKHFTTHYSEKDYFNHQKMIQKEQLLEKQRKARELLNRPKPQDDISATDAVKLVTKHFNEKFKEMECKIQSLTNSNQKMAKTLKRMELRQMSHSEAIIAWFESRTLNELFSSWSSDVPDELKDRILSIRSHNCLSRQYHTDIVSIVDLVNELPHCLEQILKVVSKWEGVGDVTKFNIAFAVRPFSILINEIRECPTLDDCVNAFHKHTPISPHFFSWKAKKPDIRKWIQNIYNERTELI